MEITMTDEVMQEQAAIPEEVATAETETPAVEAEEVKEAEKESKTFSQEELDRIIQKEKAKAEARAERRALKVYAEKLEAMTSKPVQQPEAPRGDGKPQMSQYDNVEDYVEAVAEWKLQQREMGARQQQVETTQRQILDKTEKIYAQAEKISEFDRDTFDELPLTQTVAQAIIDSDVAPALMAHLSSHPEEAERIASLSPARQAAEIGKLELKVATAKQVKASNAPAPIKPIGNRGGASNGDLTKMTMEEFLEARSKQGARWAR